MGAFYTVVFRRTRNLAAPSLAHVMSNAFGQSFSF